MRSGDDGTIYEATINELWRMYIDEEYDREMKFYDFLSRCIEQGIHITKVPHDIYELLKHKQKEK